MKTLYLLRHAKSSWSDPKLEDRDRPLNKRGRRAAALMAVHIGALREPPELVLCSAAARTRETAQYLLDAMEEPPRVRFEDALYLATSDRLLARLRRLDDGVTRALLLGHNPGLHELALRLGGRGPRDLARRFGKFPTAALATFAVNGPWRELDAGSVTFRDYVTPAGLSPGELDDP